MSAASRMAGITIKATAAEREEALQALYDLMQYIGGWDLPSDHPCSKAAAVLKKYGKIKDYP